jgi:hypothetical protein
MERGMEGTRGMAPCSAINVGRNRGGLCTGGYERHGSFPYTEGLRYVRIIRERQHASYQITDSFCNSTLPDYLIPAMKSPPSTTKSCPVTKLARSLASQQRSSAISSGCPTRPTSALWTTFQMVAFQV